MGKDWPKMAKTHRTKWEGGGEGWGAEEPHKMAGGEVSLK